MFEEPLPGREVAWDCTSLSMARSIVDAVTITILRRMSFCKLLNGMFTVGGSFDWLRDERDVWKHAVIPLQTSAYAVIYMIATHAWCRS